MKPKMIIAIAVVGIAVIAVLGYQQTQINEIERQMNLDDTIAWCASNTNYYSMESVEWYGQCLGEAFKEYGTAEQYQNWIGSQEQVYQEQLLREENSKSAYDMMMDMCREDYFGQINEMKSCFEGAELIRDAILSDIDSSPTLNCNFTPTQQMLLQSLLNDESGDIGKSQQVQRIYAEACR